MTTMIGVPQLAERLNLDQSTIHRRIAAKVLTPTSWVGSRPLFSEEDAARLTRSEHRPSRQLEQRAHEDDEQKDAPTDQEDALVGSSSPLELLGAEVPGQPVGPGRRALVSPPARAGLPAPGLGGGERPDGGGSASGGGLRDTKALPANTDRPRLGANGEPKGTSLHALTESQLHGPNVADVTPDLTEGVTR